MTESDTKMKEEIDSSFEQDQVASTSKPKAKRKIYPKEGAECVECKKFSKKLTKNMCSACYSRARRTLPEYNVPNCCCIECMAVAKVDKHGRCRKCSQAKYSKLWKENVDKYRECKGCKQTKLIYAHGLCNTCYQQSKPKIKHRCQECGKSKIIHSKNVCANCQRLKRAKTDIRMCKNCGEMLPHAADQMCQQCYDKTRRRNSKQHKECKKCGQIEFIHGHGMCQTCCVITRKEDSSQHKKCVKCNKTKYIEGHGMCINCYQKDKAQRLKSDTSKHKECAACKQAKLIYARGVCSACYQKIFSRPKQMAKKRLAKQTAKKPKSEPVSSDDELNEREVSPISTESFKLEQLSDGEMRSVSPASIDEEDFKVEKMSDDDEEFDPDKPGPSWKY